MPVSYGFMDSTSFAVPQRFSAPRELAVSDCCEFVDVIVIAEESQQASTDSDSSAVVRRIGRLSRKREAASRAASREVPLVERRLNILPAESRPDEDVDSMHTPLVSPDTAIHPAPEPVSRPPLLGASKAQPRRWSRSWAFFQASA